MEYLGIDPGLDGALVRVSEHGEVLSTEKIPLIGEKMIDLQSLWEMFKYHADGNVHGVLEQVSSRTGQGVSSVFKFGRVYGQTEAFLAAAQIPYTLVSPGKWQRVMHAGVEKALEPKDRSKMAALRLFPGVDLRKSDRSKKPDEGIVDALLLAEYMRRQNEYKD